MATNHKFIIEPHFRLQEWIAEEKGYFKDEGLDYIFREIVQSTDGKIHDKGNKVGAFQSFEQGRKSDVSCACHWTVNVAAASGHGRLNRDVYSVAPSGVFVAPDSPIKTPADLAGVPISVGFQSGSHYASIQALESYMPKEQINLSFNDGMLFKRMELLLDGKIPAATLFSGPYYLAEQLGFRKIMDNTFMIATMIHGDPDPDDLRKYFTALKRAQRDLDLRPELYTHYYKNEFPVRWHEVMDTRRWGPGERLVFETYTEETFNTSRDWIARARYFRRRRPRYQTLRGRDGKCDVIGYSGARAKGPRTRNDDFYDSARFRHLQPDQAIQRGVILQQFRRTGAMHYIAALETIAFSVSDSAISACCSTRMKAVPCSASMRRMAAVSSSTMMGARPSNGSSSRSSDGLVISARANASICCSPPES